MGLQVSYMEINVASLLGSFQEDIDAYMTRRLTRNASVASNATEATDADAAEDADADEGDDGSIDDFRRWLDARNLVYPGPEQPVRLPEAPRVPGNPSSDTGAPNPLPDAERAAAPTLPAIPMPPAATGVPRNIADDAVPGAGSTAASSTPAQHLLDGPEHAALPPVPVPKPMLAQPALQRMPAISSNGCASCRRTVCSLTYFKFRSSSALLHFIHGYTL